MASYNDDIDSRDSYVDNESVDNSQFSKLENLLLTSKSLDEDTVTSVFSIMRDGEEQKLTIRFKKLSYHRYSSLKKSVTKTRKGIPDTDYDKYRMRVVTDLMVDPNFNKKALMDSLKVMTPEQALTKVFFAGEVIQLADMILEASGFETDPFRDSVPDNEGDDDDRP